MCEDDEQITSTSVPFCVMCKVLCVGVEATPAVGLQLYRDRKSTRLNSSHGYISYAVFFLNDPAPPEIYALSIPAALRISSVPFVLLGKVLCVGVKPPPAVGLQLY